MNSTNMTNNSLQHNLNEYKSSIQSLNLKDYTVTNFLTVKKSIEENVIKKFTSTVCLLLGINKLSQKEDIENIVQGILYNNINDINKKRQQNNYYRQNARAFIYTIKRILNETGQIHKEKPVEECFSIDYIRENMQILDNMLLDSVLLIRQIATFKKIKTSLNYSKASHDSAIFMIQALHDILYGKSTTMFYPTRSVFPAIAIIRIMIETKIRYAFGIIGYKNGKDNAIDPVQLSKIFNVIEPFVKCGNIKFSCKFENIKNIYSWTNIYIHSGYKSFVWYPYIIYDYLFNFFYAIYITSPNGHFNADAGIIIKKGTLEKIRNCFEKELIFIDDEKILQSLQTEADFL